MSRDIAILFLGPRHSRWEGGQLHVPAASTPGKTLVPIVQEAGWAPGPAWTGGKSRPHRDSIPDRPARSHCLYRLSCVIGFNLGKKILSANGIFLPKHVDVVFYLRIFGIVHLVGLINTAPKCTEWTTLKHLFQFHASLCRPSDWVYNTVPLPASTKMDLNER